MRFLDRTAVPAPACLAKYHHGRHNWSDLAGNGSHLREVCGCLERLQGARCAYCESDLSAERTSAHVEHFERRSRVPVKTFDWQNLFRSCSHIEHCGKHKDERAATFALRDILKPDVDHPRRYLFFTSDGKVHPRAGLSEADQLRATETIRVFALNANRLRGCRRDRLAAFVAVLREALEAALNDADMLAYMRLTADDHEDDPYSSAIRDVLGVPPS